MLLALARRRTVRSHTFPADNHKMCAICISIFTSSIAFEDYVTLHTLCQLQSKSGDSFRKRTGQRSYDMHGRAIAAMLTIRGATDSAKKSGTQALRRHAPIGCQLNK
jgi:hypothetical protein